jgi:nucleotidyltransferase substrate binding protein (TIGR01987 family)
MELKHKAEDFAKALERLGEGLKRAEDEKKSENFIFYRDAVIQRFEFTLEIAWKSVKSFLYLQDGIECRSPKGCFREFIAAGYFGEDAVVLLEMVDDRNLATHTYHERLAEEIYEHIVKEYYVRLRDIYRTIKNESGIYANQTNEE